MSAGDISLKLREKPVKERFQFGPWTLSSVKSHILESEGISRQRFESELELPQLPEMIFAENVLRLEHEAGFGLEFNALDSLKLVDAHNDPLKVAAAAAWREARADSEFIKDVVKPFDWTYTTDYKGTMFGKDDQQLQISLTEERIDMEKLKVREKIFFYDDILLFEDELADNGTASLRAKIRVMASGYFILLRFFLRVDDVMVRLTDTRIYHQAGSDYILREYSCKDNQIKELKVSPNLLIDPTELSGRLTVRKEVFEKLTFPEGLTTEAQPQPETVAKS